MTSRIPGFYGWPLEDRRRLLAKIMDGPVSDLAALDPGALSLDLADKLIENVIGVLGVPVGLGLNLMVNGDDVLVPMAVEEPSVVAAFSHAAKMVRSGGGFFAEADPSHMIAQVQLTAPGLEAARTAAENIRASSTEIEETARSASAAMEARGGGFRRLDVRVLEDPEGGRPMVVLHLVIDVVDAMGANAVNRVAESVAPAVERATGLAVNLRILSNLATERLARARARVPYEVVGGESVAHKIAEADRFARIDPYRAATHNKGILNGIDAVALATGNDWRSIEAGAHAYAAREGRYQSLTRWEAHDGILSGFIELPLAVGTVGGTTRSHPTITLLRRVMNVKNANQLASVFAAVGLAQNLAALRALADEGIQRGHMALHAKQLALAAGAAPDEVDAIVQDTLASGEVTMKSVEDALCRVRGQQRPNRGLG